MRQHFAQAVCAVLLTALPLFAEAKRPPLNASKNIEIIYVNADWNKNPKQADSGTIFIRDAQTNRLVEIHLNETNADSSTFTGTYSLSWSNEEEFVPEIYIPNQHLLTSKAGLQTVFQEIKTQKLKRRPFVLRNHDSNRQVVEIFDSKEDAQETLTNYRELVQLAKLKKDPSAREEALREAERVKEEIVERQRLLAQAMAFDRLPANERSARRQKAKKLADQAMVAYSKEQFKQAQELFSESISADPTVKTAYYQYAVTLYKNDNYNRSIVYLRLSKDSPSVNQTERHYYEGLNYFKLKELDNAIKTFRQVRKKEDKVIGPSAAFYEGIVHYQKAEYDSAKACFQESLDTSDDPNLDKASDSYMDQIAAQQIFLAEQAKKYFLTASLGVMYDSNITLLSNGTASSTSPSDKEGTRFMAAGGMEYRSVYERDHEWSTLFNFSTLYTVTDGLVYNRTLAAADPSQYSLYEAYRRKTTWFGKAYRLEVSPGVELITMAAERTRDTSILNSYVLKLNNAFIMNERWYMMPIFEIRQDNSLLTASTADNNSTANKETVTFSNLLLLGKNKDRTMTGDLGFAINNALGVDYYYTRFDAALGYTAPFWWKMSWNAKIAYYNLAYTEILPMRTENDFAYTAGLTRPINDWLMAGASLGFTDNASNDPAHAYTKWTALFTLATQKWY